MTPFRQRVTDIKYMAAKDLAANPNNWRLHPRNQMQALRGVVDEIGQAGALLAYYSAQNGGKLTLIDGHGRQELDEEAVWPVLITDLTDEEAELLLTVYDPISALADANKPQLLDLAERVKPKNQALQDLCAQLARAAAPPEQTEDEQQRLKEENWPIVKVALPPDIFQIWSQIVKQFNGDKRAAFEVCMAAYGPLDSPVLGTGWDDFEDPDAD